MVRALVVALACCMPVMFTPALTRTAAGQAADLPQRDAFLREVREAISRSQEVAHRYAYKERRTELRLNPFGRMGSGVTLVYDVRPAPNAKLTYRRLIERDGVAVSKVELDRQDADYAARARRIAASGDDESPAARERRRGEDLLARKRAQMIVDDVVGALQFDIARREFKDGKPQIVIAFAANRDARPVTREGRLIKSFRGHVWVDEASREVTDVRATAIENVGFGGGFIGKIYEGMETVVERHEIETGVWMPTRLTLRGDVRAIFRRARIDHVVEWFDYRAMP
ncbi:MAG TPA: hypothetical protein VFZ31_13645 [Vicinamibacterales bacterium]